MKRYLLFVALFIVCLCLTTTASAVQTVTLNGTSQIAVTDLNRDGVRLEIGIG